MWGDAGRWAGWCIPGSERAWRLFLSLVAPDGTPQPWPVSGDDLHAQLWWPDLAEYPGTGGAGLCLETASGAIAPTTLAALYSALTSVTGENALWRYLQDQPGPPRCDTRGPLTDLTRTWTTSFAGRAWCLNSPVSVAAPAYADSLLVAGPARLGFELTRHGLQIAPAAPSTNHRFYLT